MVTGYVWYVIQIHCWRSLTVLVLLFVFWYCHKRGKEVRLERERELTEQEVERLDQEYKATHPGERFTTTAAENASIGEVQAGIDEVKMAKQAAATSTSTEKGP